MTDAERYAITVRKVLVDDQEMWRTTVRELPDLAEFAETREEAIELALDSIESLKASAAEDGRSFPEPIEEEEEYSGRVTLRMSKSMHRSAAQRADAEEVSLNSYIVECIALRLGSFVNPHMSAGSFPLSSYIDYFQAQAIDQSIAVVGTESLSNVMVISGGAAGVRHAEVPLQFSITSAAALSSLNPSAIPESIHERRKRA